MPAFYVLDGFKVYSHLGSETTERFVGQIRSRGMLAVPDDPTKSASLFRIAFDGTDWSVAIIHIDKTIFIDKIVQERYNPRGR